MKRAATPALSPDGQDALDQYRTVLEQDHDAHPATIRNYLSDLRHFIAWCESTWASGHEDPPAFAPMHMSTPLITRHRSYLQHSRQLKPASINRALVSIKRYSAWAAAIGHIARDVAGPVKLVPAEPSPARQLTDIEEEALVTAVMAHGSVRDQTILILMLHTGLRAQEVCSLQRESVHLGKRSGSLQVYGKRNKYREVPLNATARAALATYLADLAPDAPALFRSQKTGQALTVRALGYLIARYARLARLTDVSPHDLRHRFGYRMAAAVPLHRLAQIMGHDSLDTTMGYIRGTRQDLQAAVEQIAWE